MVALPEDLKTLNDQQVVDMFCLTTRDLETLQQGPVAEFCFRHGNKSLLLASEQLVLIWNSSACYISYGDVQKVSRFLNCGRSLGVQRSPYRQFSCDSSSTASRL